MNITKEYTQSISATDFSPELNKTICDEICEKLTALGIYNERYCTTQIAPVAFPHDFILVYYKTKDYNRLLIDPMFAVLEETGKIDLEQVAPTLKTTLDNLRTSGIASISNIGLSNYIDLFNKYEKVIEASKSDLEEKTTALAKITRF